MFKFITTDRSIAQSLAKRGIEVSGTLDEQVPIGEFYVYYSDRQMRRVKQYVERKLKWNVRIRNAKEVISLGWYLTPETAIEGAKRAVALDSEFKRTNSTR